MSAVLQKYCEPSQDTPCAPHATRAFSVSSGSSVSPGVPPVAQFNDNMNGEERASARADVLRVVHRYRSTEYELGSGAGKWAIHETRVGVEIDLEEASVVEVLEAIALAELRRAVYAKPAPRTDVKPTPRSDGIELAEDVPLRGVAPRPLTAQIVRVRPHRATSGGDSGVRAWRGTVGWCWKPLPEACKVALFEGADVAAARVPIRNNLQEARSVYERMNSGGRKARRIAATVGEAIHRLEAEDGALYERLDGVVTGVAHQLGLERLEREIYRYPDRPQVVFGGLL